MTRTQELLTEINARAVLLSLTLKTPALEPIVKRLVMDSEKALEIESEKKPKLDPDLAHLHD